MIFQPNKIAKRDYGLTDTPVDSCEHAAKLWRIEVERNGAGVSEIGNGGNVIDGPKVVGRISYNGRIWKA